MEAGLRKIPRESRAWYTKFEQLFELYKEPDSKAAHLIAAVYFYANQLNVVFLDLEYLADGFISDMLMVIEEAGDSSGWTAKTVRELEKKIRKKMFEEYRKEAQTQVGEGVDPAAPARGSAGAARDGSKNVRETTETIETITPRRIGRVVGSLDRIPVDRIPDQATCGPPGETKRGGRARDRQPARSKQSDLKKGEKVPDLRSTESADKPTGSLKEASDLMGERKKSVPESPGGGDQETEKCARPSDPLGCDPEPEPLSPENELEDNELELNEDPLMEASAPLLQSCTYESLRDSNEFAIGEVVKMVVNGTLEVYAPKDGKPKVVYPLGVVNLPKGRLVVNARYVNLFSKRQAFKYKTLREVLTFLTERGFFTTWDFKAGYYHLLIHPAYRKYFGIKVGQVYMHYNGMYLGWSEACFLYTLLTQEAAKELRLRSVPVSSSLDDGLTGCEDFWRCVWATRLDEWNGRRWFPRQVAVVAGSDASDTGFGGKIQIPGEEKLTVIGNLSETEMSMSSMAREMVAFFPVLKEARERAGGALKGAAVLLRGDNQAAVRAVNAMNSRALDVNVALLLLFELCIEADFDMVAQWKPREEMQEEDDLSKFQDSSDSGLAQEAVRAVLDGFGVEPAVDLFGSDTWHVAERFLSLHSTPEALAADAMRVDWSLLLAPGEVAWIFPPVCLLSQVVQAIRLFQTDCVLIVPEAPATNWWLALQKFGRQTNMRGPLELPRGERTCNPSFRIPNGTVNLAVYKLRAYIIRWEA
ncbi:Hypothetical protein KFL_014130020 [Klebsormidium nitens]|uniref:Reverse transcriptase n=1 Tax=Klebsormidium nitens TaxID=105231 RepID=A0A1Y1IT63_KLENI|nr:Hypothetical protein KFL_014130020 [Klebsormidium nitens]|eukprot:GAQ93282.1 Hypothetical protein KFL_014130020 [Klebsormidium nitens]